MPPTRSQAPVRSPVRSCGRTKVCSQHPRKYLQSYLTDFTVYKILSRNITALHFPATGPCSKLTSILTAIPRHETAENPSFPAVEHALGTSGAVRECTVTVQDAARRSRSFVVFFQYNEELLPNKAILNLFPESSWKGQLLVMKRGENCFVTGLTGRQNRNLAELALRR